MVGSQSCLWNLHTFRQVWLDIHIDIIAHISSTHGWISWLVIMSTHIRQVSVGVYMYDCTHFVKYGWYKYMIWRHDFVLSDGFRYLHVAIAHISKSSIRMDICTDCTYFVINVPASFGYICIIAHISSSMSWIYVWLYRHFVKYRWSAMYNLHTFRQVWSDIS